MGEKEIRKQLGFFSNLSGDFYNLSTIFNGSSLPMTPFQQKLNK